MGKAKSIKRSIKKCINEIAAASDLYCQNPGSDFTRNRKLPFSDMMKAILCFSGKSLNKEMLEIFGCKSNIASVSAFVQQRSKLKASAFEALFHNFTNKHTDIKLFNGYRLLAVDGSDINIPTDINDKLSSFQINGNMPYNLYHLNAMYDLCSNTYVDAIVQKRLEFNEHKAFIAMAERFKSSYPTIFIADRGYESFNNMAHIQEIGQFFVIRLKDINSSGISRGFHLQDCGDSFDIPFNLNLTRKQSNDVKRSCKDKTHFKYLHHSTPFDFLPSTLKKSDPLVFFNLRFRLVRFEISDGNYELLATNLNPSDFPPEKLKELYAMRWGIETSFRHLKYTLALNNFHSKKSEGILQEVFAKLTMYNFTQMITSHIIISKAKRKHLYKINFSVAVHTCRNLLLGFCSPTDAEAVIQRHIIPVRLNLHKPRNLNQKAYVSFSYRLA